MAHKRTTKGTLERDAKVSRLQEMIIERQRIETMIDSLLGHYVRLQNDTVAEIIGISDGNPYAPRIEWLAGNEQGECLLTETRPTLDMPKHIVEFEQA